MDGGYRFKRLVSLLLSALLIAAMLTATSCAPKSEVEPEISLPEDDPLDLGGYEFILGQNLQTDKFIFGYTEGTSREDLVSNRINDLKTSLNISFEVKTIPADATTYLMTAVATGDPVAECIQITDLTQVNNCMKGEAFEPLSEYADIIDLTDTYRWGTPYQREIGMYHGVHYLVSPFSWPDKTPSTLSCVIFNNDLVTAAGIPDLRSMLEDKTWTWDKFLELISDWTYQDGEEKMYGTCSSNWATTIIRTAFFSNGGRIAYTDGNGEIHSDLETQLALDTFDFVKKLITDYQYCFYGDKYKYGSTWEDYLDPFINGRCYTTIIHAHAIIGRIAQEAENFGLMPFPVGPNGSFTEFPVNVESTNLYGIPTSADSTMDAAIVINELFAPFAEFDTEDKLIDEYDTNFFYDRRDAELFLKLSKNVDYSYWPDNGDTFWNTSASALVKSSPAEVIQKNLPPYLEIIKEYIAPNREVVLREVEELNTQG